MMQITHAATGALAGSLMPDLALAFLAGILVHFVVDMIPHYWPKSKKGKKTQVIIDHSITYFIFALMLIFGIGNENIWAGIAGSLLVDIIIVGIPLVRKTPLGRWHTERQPHHTKSNWLASDILVTMAELFILFGNPNVAI